MKRELAPSEIKFNIPLTESKLEENTKGIKEFDEAYKNYSTACSMEPQNREYTDAFNNLNNNASGGYRTSHEKGTGCSACDICSGLMCADCCCECMGGDLIPWC